MLNIAQKYTGCAHLLDDGWDVPRCVDQCPTDALRFGEESDLKELIEKADEFRPELGLKTRVHYLNLPKKFVGGLLYEPKIKEVVIGAKCTLTDTEGGETFSTETDRFGDFWFRNLRDDRNFCLKLEKDGKAVNLDNISTSDNVNLGDIPLE
jgi:tetrathionate reductase subunit B